MTIEFRNKDITKNQSKITKFKSKNKLISGKEDIEIALEMDNEDILNQIDKHKEKGWVLKKIKEHMIYQTPFNDLKEPLIINLLETVVFSKGKLVDTDLDIENLKKSRNGWKFDRILTHELHILPLSKNKQTIENSLSNNSR